MLDHEEREPIVTRKVKRAAVTRRFEAEIEAMYR